MSKLSALSPKSIWYRLKACFTDGVLRLANDTRIPISAKIIWQDGRVVLGKKLRMRSGVILDAQRGSIEIGNNVSLNDYTIVLGQGGVTIGNGVRIAGHVMIIAFEHNFADATIPIRKQGNTLKPIIIEDDVWIGAGAKILGGAHITKGCVIGANAVVKGKLEPYGVYAGIPARLVKKREHLAH